MFLSLHFESEGGSLPFHSCDDFAYFNILNKQSTSSKIKIMVWFQMRQPSKRYQITWGFAKKISQRTELKMSKNHFTQSAKNGPEMTNVKYIKREN